MTKKKLCEMCTEYNAGRKCDIKDSCELQKILKENEMIKKECKKLKEEVNKLISDLNWAKDDNQMGRW